MFHSRYGQSFVSVCVGTAFLVLALATSSSVLSCKFILSFVIRDALVVVKYITATKED